jgi:Animal haem peroxidase
LLDLALSFGRQRAGALTLGNHPAFLQGLDLKDPAHPGRTIDVAALDILRDRERGIPRFNEFRRQIGLRPLTSFDDFIDQDLLTRDPALTPDEKATLTRQRELAAGLRKVYGTHVCDKTRITSTALKVPDPKTQKMEPPTDCLGFPNGTIVDNVEDLDTVVGYLAESTRPHGFAISETQFQIFIINASRRLFSDRFFTSSFRPEFYSQFGYDWVMNNGPEKMLEPEPVNGHIQPVAPMKRVLIRTIPELEPELKQVINTFDPWARDRGDYYSTKWNPRPDALDDLSFVK